MDKSDTAKMTEPVLTEEDRNSPIWKKIKAHFESRLQSHRTKNDNQKSEMDTAKLRGAIAECKYITGLDKPPPKTEFDDPDE